MPRFHVRPTSRLHAPVQLAKRLAYRSALFKSFTRPVYPLLVDPVAVAELIRGIDQTRDGCIVEVGVARGMTTVFLNEHLLRNGDKRRYLCIDTFSGFTAQDVEHEVSKRGKDPKLYGAFRYNDASVFRRNLAAYPNVEIIAKDICTINEIEPVAVALVDVDLYRPVLHSLELIYPHLVPGGLIVVDDVNPKQPFYDGAHQAYMDFCAAHGITPTMLSTKTALVKMGTNESCRLRSLPNSSASSKSTWLT